MNSSSSTNVFSNDSNCVLDSVRNVIKEQIDSLSSVCFEKVQEKIVSLESAHFKEAQEKLESIKDSVVSYFKSSIDSIFADTNSAFMDKAIASHWYGYFDDSFDKLMSSYTALVVAVLTVVGAIFVLKHWYDKRDFDKKINEMQNDWKSNLSDLQEKTKQIDVELEKIGKIEKDFQDKITEHDSTINSSISNKADDEWLSNEKMTIGVSYLFWKKMKDKNTSRELLKTISESIQKIRDHFPENDDNRFIKSFIQDLFKKDVVNTLFVYINDIDDANFHASILDMSVSLWKTIQGCNNPQFNSESLEKFIISPSMKENDDDFDGVGVS